MSDSTETEMSFDRFYALRQRMQAFSQADLQKFGVAVQWMRSLGHEDWEIMFFIRAVPAFLDLERIGFFRATHTVEELKAIRSYEKSLPKSIRKEVRQARLRHAYVGPIGKHN